MCPSSFGHWDRARLIRSSVRELVVFYDGGVSREDTGVGIFSRLYESWVIYKPPTLLCGRLFLGAVDEKVVVRQDGLRGMSTDNKVETHSVGPGETDTSSRLNQEGLTPIQKEVFGSESLVRVGQSFLTGDDCVCVRTTELGTTFTFLW